MSNYTRNTLTGDLAPINAELEKVQNAIADKLDRSPAAAQANQLNSTLDANSNRLINLPAPLSLGEPVRLGDVLPATQITTTALIASTVSLPADTVVSTTGYTTSGDGGGGKWKQNGVTGQTVSQSPSQLADALFNDANGVQWSLVITNTLNVKSLGAIGDGTADDTLPIQSALNVTTPHETYLPAGTYSVRSTGTMNARGYALLLPSRTSLVGAGVSLTTISAFNDGLIYEVLTDNRNSFTTGIEIHGFTIFGDHDNRPKGGMGLWIQRSTDLKIGDIFVESMTGFGIRLNKCKGVFWDSIKVKTTFYQSNDDGIHLYDCSDVVGNKAIVETEGDDCFIITAETEDVANISVDQIVVTSPTGNRGVLLNLGDSANAMHSISNIRLGVVANDCPNGPAVLLFKADFYNIDITVQSIGCRNALRFDLASIGYGLGSLKNSSFNVRSYNDTENGIYGAHGSVISGNTLNALVYNNGDTYNSVSIAGSDWQGSIGVNHDPAGTKVSPQSGFDCNTTDSNFLLSVVNADKGLNLRSTAQDNTFNIGSIKNTVSHSIDNASGASANRFSGGVIDSTVNIAGNNSFFGTKGADAKGNTNSAISGTGVLTIPHSLVQAPSYVSATYAGANTYIAKYNSSDSTNMSIGLFDENGAAVTTGTHRVIWQASL
jgi:hypothetical protein